MIYVVYIKDSDGDIYEMRAFTSKLLADKYVEYLEENNHDFDDEDDCTLNTEAITLDEQICGDCE